MTPQEWIDEAGKRWRWPHGEFGQIGAQHLAAALDAVATMSPACARCQSAHCCSVTGSAVPPLCVTDPDGSLPLWMPWTNADVQERVDPLHAQVDALREEIDNLRKKLEDAEEFAENMRQNRDEVLRTSTQQAKDSSRLRIVVQNVYAAIANEVLR